ncbi:MAG: YybH family protein [Actinomycetota bacterium]
MDDFDGVRTRSREALDRLARGDASGYRALFSRGEDLTLANPFGGFGRGWDEVVELVERAGSYYSDGGTTGFETITEVVTPDWAYTVEIERFRARVGGAPDITDLALRVTCIYRLEEDGWRLVHRHADPRVEKLPAESVIQD